MNTFSWRSTFYYLPPRRNKVIAWCITFRQATKKGEHESFWAINISYCRIVTKQKTKTKTRKSTKGFFFLLQFNSGPSIIIVDECVSVSFRTGRLERELRMVQLSATRCSCVAITLCIASQRVFIVVVYFVIDSVRKLLDTSLYICCRS
jgi:hypothetical protein